jgi:hypothetical protein
VVGAGTGGLGGGQPPGGLGGGAGGPSAQYVKVWLFVVVKSMHCPAGCGGGGGGGGPGPGPGGQRYGGIVAIIGQYVRVWLSVAVIIHDGGDGGEVEAHIVVAGSAATEDVSIVFSHHALRKTKGKQERTLGNCDCNWCWRRLYSGTHSTANPARRLTLRRFSVSRQYLTFESFINILHGKSYLMQPLLVAR